MQGSGFDPSIRKKKLASGEKARLIYILNTNPKALCQTRVSHTNPGEFYMRYAMSHRSAPGAPPKVSQDHLRRYPAQTPLPYPFALRSTPKRAAPTCTESSPMVLQPP